MSHPAAATILPLPYHQGLCQRCGAKGCTYQFHAICAKLAGWFFQSPGQAGEPPVVLCPGHVPERVYKCVLAAWSSSIQLMSPLVQMTD